jgi:peptidoglycan/LPS O-acetylase OafA/YrhL
MVKYISGLNGIRAIAVLLVIISHRFPKEHIINALPLGNYGVDIFFVLSGFLISRSLFYQITETSVPNKKIIKRFFFRRFLRIFPIYYLLLLFMFLTSGIIGNQFKENFLWYFFYWANYLNYYEDKWFGALAHLWSLSVEEQFYIFWPILLLFVFKKRIFYLICFLVIVGTVYPFFINGNANILTLSCVNALGIGALLAYTEIVNKDYTIFFNKTLSVIFIPVLLMLCINKMVVLIPFFSERLAISILAVSIISYCRYRPDSFLVAKILNNKILNFIGIISYGVYLCHNIVPKYWVWGIKKLGLETPASIYKFSYLEVFIQTLFIIGISYLSGF